MAKNKGPRKERKNTDWELGNYKLTAAQAELIKAIALAKHQFGRELTWSEVFAVFKRLGYQKKACAGCSSCTCAEEDELANFILTLNQSREKIKKIS